MMPMYDSSRLRRSTHMDKMARGYDARIVRRQGPVVSALSSILDPAPDTTPAADSPTSVAAATSTPAAPATTSSSGSSGDSGGSTSSNGSSGGSSSGSSGSNSGGNSGKKSQAASPSASRGSSSGNGSGGSGSSAAAQPSASAAAASAAANGQPAAATAGASAAAASVSVSVGTVVSVSTGSNGQLSSSTFQTTSTATLAPGTSPSASSPLLSGSSLGDGNLSGAQQTAAALAGGNSGSKGSSHKAVAIAVPIVIVFGILLIALVVFFMRRHRKKNENKVWESSAMAAAEEGGPGSTGRQHNYGSNAQGKSYAEGSDVGASAALGTAAGIYGMRRNKSITSLRRAIKSGEFEYDDASSYGEHTEMSHGANGGQPVSAYRAGGEGNTSAITEETSAMGMPRAESHGDFAHYGVDEAAYPTHDDEAIHTNSGYAGGYHGSSNPAPQYGAAAQGYTNTAMRGHDASGYDSGPSDGAANFSSYPGPSRGYSNSRDPPQVSYAGIGASTDNSDQAYGGADFLSNQYNYNNAGGSYAYDSRFSPRSDSDERQGFFSGGNNGGPGSKVRSLFANSRFAKR